MTFWARQAPAFMRDPHSKGRKEKQMKRNFTFDPRRSKRPNQRGIAVPTSAILLAILIPFLGLVIDAGIFYAVKTKLQLSVDAAALAGARALGRDGYGSAQAENIARAYLKLNFPDHYFFTDVLNVDMVQVRNTANKRREINVGATANVNTMFTRWIGITTFPISAQAAVTRRDTNLVLVMDRSGSLNANAGCPAVKMAATDFITKFAEGRDYLGLVTFATTSWVDYAAQPTFKSGGYDMDEILGNLSCDGWTNSSQGLWDGYSELVRLNQPNAMNVIVFFSDGNPTVYTANMQPEATSSCLDQSMKLGVLTPGGSSGILGMFKPRVGAQPITPPEIQAIPGLTGCAMEGNGYEITMADFSHIPLLDAYGNRLNTGYKPVTTYGPGLSLGADTIANGVINAADDAARRIRLGEPVATGGRLEGVQIFTIGLGTVEQEFMRRVANDPAALNHDPGQTSGEFVYAATADDLHNAFQKVASEVLRLAK
jgi:Flp pilus assembly protein TadG